MTTALILLNLYTSFVALKEASGSRIIISFRGPDHFFSIITDEKGNNLHLLLGETLVDLSNEAPLIPFFDIKVALSNNASFHCKVNPIKVSSIEGALIPTVPYFTDDGLTPHYSVYRGAKAPEKTLLCSGKTEIINGIPTAHILFSPYLYDPETGKLTYIMEAELEITIKETKEKFLLRRGWYDAIYENTFLNYQGVLKESHKLLPQNPFENGSIWFNIKVTKEGFYRVTYNDLKNAGLPYPFHIEQIALYIRGVDTLPSAPPTDSTVFFVKLPFSILDKNQDGVLNAEDEILFFTPGPEGIRISPGADTSTSAIVSRVNCYRNPYSDTTSVWLTFGIAGDTIIRKDLNFSSSVNGLFSYYHYEKDLINVAWKGLLWVGEELYRPPSYSFTTTSMNFDIPSPLESSGFMRIRYAGGQSTFRQFRVVLNSSDSIYETSSGYVLKTTFTRLTSLQPSNNIQLTLSSTNSSVEDRVYLDFFTIFYKRSTDSFKDEVAFFATPETILARFPVSSEVNTLLDITDPRKPKIVEIHTQGNNKYTSDTLYPGKCYYFAATLKKPARIELSSNAGSLYQLRTNPDYILITPRAFVSSLLAYKNYREHNLLKYVDGEWIKSTGKVEICTVEDIMRDFGFGIYDPIALRNFLKYQFEKSDGNLVYVGLFGDACYDYRNINGTGGNLVPAYEPFLSTNIEEEKGAKDDFYVDFGGDGYGDIFIGRIPFRTKEQLSIFLDKIYKYESNVAFNNWRSRVLFIADDEYGESGLPSEIGFHIPFANYIRIDTVLTPPFFEVKLVYETSYGISGNSVNLTKRGQEAKLDFIRKFNDGNFITTFFGHGNPVQLTHERMLLLQDLPLLDAGFKNPISMFLSCKVGAFTRENPPMGIGEYMSVYRQSIGTISSTIGQFVSINFFFGRSIHQVLSDRRTHPLGEAVNRAKMTSIYLTYYHLFGDPATIVYYPVPDSLIFLNLPDTFWIGRPNTVKLTGQVPAAQYYTIFFHKPYLERYTNPSNSSVYVDYMGENKILYRAPYRFKGTSMDSVVFFIPGTADTGRSFCFSILKKQDGTISSIYASNLRSALGNISTQDREGPEIKVFINGKDVASVKEAPLSFSLRAVLEDSSGINLYNVFAEEKGIMLFVDNAFQDLTPYFEFHTNSYSSGEVNYTYSAAQQGQKDFKLIAYDNLNNFRQLSFSLNLKTTADIFSDVLLYPNPVSKGDRLYIIFRLNEPARVKMEIFTVASRRIYQTPETYLPQGFNELHWNLRDIYGEPVSNGLYIIKLTFLNDSNIKQEIIKGIVLGK